MKKHSLLLALGLILSLIGRPAAFAADAPPKIDYTSLKAPISVIAGDYLEFNFRVTDDVGLNSIGPVASIRSIQYPSLFFYFSNCYLNSGDRKDGNWTCKIPTEKSNPLGNYKLILVLTDTVGQHSTEEPLTGWTNIANFEMREISAAEKAAEEKAAAEKLAAAKVATEKAAADKVASDKVSADKAVAENVILERLNIISKLEERLARMLEVSPELQGKIFPTWSQVIKVKNLDLTMSDQIFQQTISPLIKQIQALERIKTIICVKGKNTKKVIGISPKCPAGYKKK